MKRSTLSLTVLGLASLSFAIAPVAQAADIDFASWAFTGDVDIPGTGSADLSTASSLFEDDFPDPAGAFNFSGLDVTPTDAFGGSLEDDLSLFPGDLDPDFFDIATEGSGLFQSLNVSVGDTLSFDWTFLTNDSDTGFGFGDYAFIAVDGVVTVLADVVNSALVPSTGPFFDEVSGNFSLTFTSGGSVDIALGVVDVSDTNNSSALSLVNAEFISENTAVPEPSTLLSLAMLGGLAALRSKQTRDTH